MKKKFKYENGEIVKHKLHKGMFLVIARMEVEHICGVKDIQYYLRNVDFKVFEAGEQELNKFKREGN